jgi:hypothetical protein
VSSARRSSQANSTQKACTRHATRHAPRTAPTPNFLQTHHLAGTVRADATGKNGQGHRAKSNAKSTERQAPEGIAPRATADGVTRTKPVSHGGLRSSPTRRQPVANPSPTRRQPAVNPSPTRRQRAGTAQMSRPPLPSASSVTSRVGVGACG